MRDGDLSLASGRVSADLPLIVSRGPEVVVTPASLDATLNRPVSHRPDLFRQLKLSMTARTSSSKGSVVVADVGADAEKKLDQPLPIGSGGFFQSWPNGELVAVSFSRHFEGARDVSVGEALQRRLAGARGWLIELTRGGSSSSRSRWSSSSRSRLRSDSRSAAHAPGSPRPSSSSGPSRPGSTAGAPPSAHRASPPSSTSVDPPPPLSHAFPPTTARPPQGGVPTPHPHLVRRCRDGGRQADEPAGRTEPPQRRSGCWLS